MGPRPAAPQERAHRAPCRPGAAVHDTAVGGRQLCRACGPRGGPDCRVPCHLLPGLTTGTFRVFQNLPPLLKLKNAYFRKCFILLKTEDTQRKTGSSENTPFFQTWVPLSQ